jgi:RNA polymerase sigma-70 factor (ECF subfamily)
MGVQRDLVVRAQGGDHDAYSVLAGAAIGRLDAAARLILRDADLAQDAVQETLIRCWRDLPTLRDPERYEAWLNRIFLNACRDQQRRLARRRVEVSLPEILPHAVPDGQATTSDRDQLERGVRRLETEHRTIIVLHYYLGLPLAESAAAMGVPVGTAKSRLHRATQALRATLEADDRARLARAEVGVT